MLIRWFRELCSTESGLQINTLTTVGASNSAEVSTDSILPVRLLSESGKSKEDPKMTETQAEGQIQGQFEIQHDQAASDTKRLVERESRRNAGENQHDRKEL